MDELGWPLSSVIYQIYPRSFQDSNGDGVGDIPGILQRLDYLKDLGVTALWLCPIYPSPQVDFGYDVANYTDIDPVFGTLTDFEQLVAACHAKGMKIMMDFIPNHTSDQHPWFEAAASSKENHKRDWYIWKDPKPDGSPPNNWLAHFGGSGWELDKKTGQYYFHSFDVHQPDLNWENPHVETAMLDVLRFWMNKGVDGFRMDAVNHIGKDTLFRDEPLNPSFDATTHGQYQMLSHIYTTNLSKYFEVMKQFAVVLQEKKQTFMVTEAWTSLEDLIKLYITVGWKWYAPFNFSLITLPWRADVHKQYIDTYDKALGDLYIPCYVLGNHDVSRVASRIGTGQARVAALLELTLRGFPFIYMGEELGMTNTDIPQDMVHDTYEKNSPGLGLGRDPQRTPMQWNSGKNAGFTTGSPWLPITKNYQQINVAKEQNDPYSFLSLYKRLLTLRKEHKALSHGSYASLPQPAENVLAFMREYEGEKLLIIVNFDDHPKNITLALRNVQVLCSATNPTENRPLDLHEFVLDGDQGYVCRLED